MGKRILKIALLLLFVIVPLTGLAYTSCSITGTVLNVDGTACANCTIAFNSMVTQTLNGTSFQPLTASTSTDASGNLTAITLPQGLTVQVTITENGQTFPPYQAIVPYLSTVTFSSFNQGILTSPLNVLASLQPPTGPLNMNAQKITNLAAPTTTGDALVWGQNATVNNLTVTGGFTQSISGMAVFGLLTDTQITTPTAPTPTAIGVTGAVTYYYFVVCHDGNGGTTLASSSGTLANANATLTSSNYVSIAWTLPTHALNCDILRNTTNTTTGAQSITGGLAVTTSPTLDQSNSTSAYTIPTRNTTGDGQFAGSLLAGGVPTGVSTGDLSTSESTTTGQVIFGTNATGILDFGKTTASRFTLTGGALQTGGTNTVISGIGDLLVAESGGQGDFYLGTGSPTNYNRLDWGDTVASQFTFLHTALISPTTTLNIGQSATSAGVLNIRASGTSTGGITIFGKTSGSATLSVPDAAGTPATFRLPTTSGSSTNVLQTDGSGNTSWVQYLPQGLSTQTGNPLATFNTSAGGTLFTFSLAGNTLGTGRVLACTFTGTYTNSSGGNDSPSFQFLYGATSISTGSMGTIASNAGAHTWRITVTLAALGATNVQGINGFIGFSQPNFAGPDTTDLTFSGTAAIDDTTAQNVQLKVTQGNNASITTSILSGNCNLN